MKKEEIIDLMVLYLAGSEIDFSIFGNKEAEIREIFALYNREWNKLEADPEGFNPKQHKAADALDEEYTNKILEITNNKEQ